MTHDAEIEILATGLQFPEGPVALADGSILVVEIASGTLTRVNPDGSTTTIAECGGGPNGAAVGPDGALYVCNNGGQDFTRNGDRLFNSLVNQPANYTGGSIQRVELATGTVDDALRRVRRSAPQRTQRHRLRRHRRLLVHRQRQDTVLATALGRGLLRAT